MMDTVVLSAVSCRDGCGVGWRKAQSGAGLGCEHEGKRCRPSEHMGPLSGRLPEKHWDLGRPSGIFCVVYV